MVRNGKPIFFPDSDKVKYAAAIHSAAKQYAPKLPIDGPIELFIRFILPRPQKIIAINPNFLLWCSTRPDYDNLTKGTQDGLSKCGFWHDDAQISRATIEKFFCESGYNPRICVKIGAMADL
jgi:Holliday junction resolvase RusA-like endonuclease